MKKRIIILSLVSMLVLGLFTGCYTSFGTVRHYNVYDDEVVYYDDDDSVNAITVYHHYRPYYPTRFVYYDPYDYWYDEPIIYISVGYNYRPHYYVTYYPYGGCIYPGWYPVVYYPHYVPVWYYGHQGYYTHHNNYRNYYDYKKRDFAKRINLPGSDYGRRDRREGFGKQSINKKYADDDANYGRRQIARRNTDIGNGDIRNISRGDDTISKRNVEVPQERSVKTKLVRKNSSEDIINRNDSSKERSKTIVEKKEIISKRSDQKVLKRKPVSTNKYDTGKSIDNNKSKQKSYSGSTRESRSNNSNSTDTKHSSSNSRPSVREKSESSSSSQTKSSGSSRSSYTPSKSSSKSSSGSSRSSYKPSKGSSKSSSGSSSNKRRR